MPQPKFKRLMVAILSGGSAAWITGTLTSGSVLTANLAPSAGTASSWQWTLNGANISGQTAQTYTVLSTDPGQIIGVNINGGAFTASVSIPAIPPVFSAAATITAASTTGITFTAATLSSAGTPTATVTHDLYDNGVLSASNYVSGGTFVVGHTMTLIPYAVQGGVRVLTGATSAGVVVASAGASIGGVVIGAAGSGIFAGFKMLWGDDFDTLPTSWAGSATTAKYGSDTPSSGARRINQAQARQIYLDPAWRGLNGDQPAAFGYSPFTQASSVVSIKTEPVPSPLVPYLPNDYQAGPTTPQLVAGCLDSWPHFLFSAAGDFCLVARIRFPAGVARGWWPAFWSTTIGNWPDQGEVDVTEPVKDSAGAITTTATMHESATDGGGDVPAGIVTARPITAGVFRTYACKKVGTTLTMYDDETTPGTLAQSGTITNAKVGRLKGAHRIRLEMEVSTAWDSTTLNIGDWPVGTMDVDYWQCWAPTAAYAPYVAPTRLPPVNVASGGSWAATFPSALSLYGAVPTLEEVYGVFDNPDAPGQATKAVQGKFTLPGGMTVDLAARTASGTVPSDRGGATALLFAGSNTAGGQAKQALLVYNVAPSVQVSLLANQSPPLNSSGSYPIAYADFHSGNLGPHAYTVTSDKAWVTVSYGTSNQTATLAYTAPSSVDTATLTIIATNVLGQTTTVTRTVNAGAAITQFADNFNSYANGNLETVASANWTFAGGVAAGATIASGIVNTKTVSSTGSMYLSPDLGSQRQSVQGNIFSPNSGGLALQATDQANYIMIRRNPSTNVIEVYKNVAATLSLQAGFAETLADADVAYLSFISNTLVVKKNGTTLTPTSGSLTVTSGPPASSRTGMVFRINGSASPAFDNFQANVI